MARPRARSTTATTPGAGRIPAPGASSPGQAGPPGRLPPIAWLAAAVAAALAAWRLGSLPNLFWAQDDAYISFRYARNLLRGEGLVYNAGERVEGYTNFLWTVLSAIPMALGQADPIVWMNRLGFALLVASYAALLGLGLLLARRGHAWAPLAIVPLLFTWSFNLWFVSGMETGLVAFFAIAGTVLVALDPREQRWAPLAASAAGVLAMLSRADALPVWLALAATGIGFELARGRGARVAGSASPRPGAVAGAVAALRPALVPWLLPIVVVYAPYTLWRVAYYGSIYPNTYYAKAIYLPAWERGWTYLATFFSVYPILLPALLVPVAAWLARDAVTRRFLTAATLVTAFVFLYVLRVGGDFMEWRFLVPVMGILLPACVLAFATLAGRLAGTRGAAARVAPAAAGVAASLGLAALMQARLVPALTVKMEGQEVIGELARYCDDRQFNWRAVARRLDGLVPRDARMAVTAAGIIPFHCDRPILDLHGLTDREIARRPVTAATRGRMGHEHYVTDMDEMRRRGAAVVVVWDDPRPEPEAASLQVAGNLALVSARIADGRWCSFFVLDTTRVALGPLRATPDVVVSAGGDAPPAVAPPAGAPPRTTGTAP